MNDHHCSYPLAALAFVGLLLVTAAFARSGSEGGGLDLSWHSIDSGGGTSIAGAYELSGTIGQPDAGALLSAGTYTLAGGFWPGAGGPAQPCEGDVNNSNAVDVDDLIAVILGWGGCPSCPPNHCASDVAPFPNGNCATDVDDLIAVILHWGACP